MTYNPKAVGERSEGMILAALLRANRVVLQPFGDNQRYDLVVDEGGGKFLRIQCKTARLKKGALFFDTCSSSGPKSSQKKGYRGQIEMFAVYSPDLDKVYLVPVDVVGEKGATLRIDPPSNNQTKGVRYASEFELIFLGSSVEERSAVNGSLGR